MRTYHDEEWGVPLHDDARLFELLTLEGAQAGLSWLTILKRRPGYVKAFKKFNPRAVAAFSADDVERLLGDVDIIRHRGKIESTINNAGAVLALQNKVRVSMNSCGPSSTTNRCNEIGRTNQTFPPRRARPRS